MDVGVYQAFTLKLHQKHFVSFHIISSLVVPRSVVIVSYYLYKLNICFKEKSPQKPDCYLISAGRVVNLASMYGRMGNVLRSPYCVSKYGVEAFSDCLRYEMKAWGVKVSVIEPGNFIVATGILTRDIVATTANKLWNEAPSSVKEDYGKAHFEHHMALMRSYCHGGQKDVAPVLDDITDAITSKRPYTRYNPMEPHWWIRVQLMTHLPSAISDYLYF